MAVIQANNNLNHHSGIDVIQNLNGVIDQSTTNNQYTTAINQNSQI